MNEWDRLAATIVERLSKADLTGPSMSGLDPGALPQAGGIHGVGNWAFDTAVLGLQSVLHGRTDNNPPPGRIAFRIPASSKYSDYAEAYNQLLGQTTAEVYAPVVELYQAAIDAIHLMITYRPPSTPVVGVDLNK